MKADQLKLDELIDISEGRLNLHGRRLVIHSADAFAQFRRDLVEMVGENHARQALTRFGYFWGQADAAAMNRIFKWKDKLEWLKAGPVLHALQGVVKVSVTSLKIDEKKGKFRMEVIWKDSVEAEEHLAELGKTEQPACWICTGYASGYASFWMGRNVYFQEQKCRVSGSRVCTALGQDEKSWGKELESFQQYFQAEDIKGKVQSLTKELKKKSQQLLVQRKKLGNLEDCDKPLFLEAHSSSFRRVLDIGSRVARFDTSVMIAGETGVGKEVLARFIHNNSKRAKGPFIAVNCGALPETLLESELFGHKRGSFTGATSDRVGLFEQAAKGTLFLDEIGDVSQAMQLKLLRVLQEKEVMRVGESTVRKTDTRVMGATNRDLAKEVAKGTFRKDLLYRLQVVEVKVPPLRERQDDILPLVRHFIEQLASKLNLPKLRLDSTCVDYFHSYSWPGNVRELENAIERAAVLSHDGIVRPEYLPPSITTFVPDKNLSANPLAVTLRRMEENHIKRVLELCGGNRTKAAKALAISPTTLWRKLKNK